MREEVLHDDRAKLIRRHFPSQGLQAWVVDPVVGVLIHLMTELLMEQVMVQLPVADEDLDDAIQPII